MAYETDERPETDAEDLEHQEGQTGDERPTVGDDEDGEGGQPAAETAARARRVRKRATATRWRTELDELRRAFGEQSQVVQALLAERAKTVGAAEQNQITEIDGAIDHWTKVLAKATTELNGDDVTQATTALSKLQSARGEAVARQLVKASHAERQAPPTRDVRPTGEGFHPKALAWMVRNDFDPADRSPRAQLIKALDQQVMADGFDKTTDDYWAELDDRIAEATGGSGGAKSNGNGNGAARQRTPSLSGSGRGSMGQPGARSSIDRDRAALLRSYGIEKGTPQYKIAMEEAAAYDAQQQGER